MVKSLATVMAQVMQPMLLLSVSAFLLYVVARSTVEPCQVLAQRRMVLTTFLCQDLVSELLLLLPRQSSGKVSCARARQQPVADRLTVPLFVSRAEPPISCTRSTAHASTAHTRTHKCTAMHILRHNCETWCILEPGAPCSKTWLSCNESTAVACVKSSL